MKFLDKMERKLGKYAIHNLMLYVSVLYVIGFLIIKTNPAIYVMYLSLDVHAILQGEIWRLITFIMFPTGSNIFYLLISIYFYTFLGRTLENIWGAFKFNVYYFTGLLLTIASVFIFYFTTGLPSLTTTEYLNMSIFLAFAVTVPDMQVLLMFLIPIKVKWLAYLDAAILMYKLVEALVTGRYVIAIMILVAYLNFIIFFFGFMRRSYSPKQFIRRQKFKKAVNQGARTRSYAGSGPTYTGTASAGQGKKISRHKCAICGRTEADGEELEFRFCSKCNGNYEYCQDHLFTHTHKQ